MGVMLVNQPSLQPKFGVQLIDGRKRFVEVHKVFLKASLAAKLGDTQSSFTSSGRTQEIRFCILFLQKYVYSAAEDAFVAVPAMPTHLPAQIRRTLDNLQSIDQGKPF